MGSSYEAMISEVADLARRIGPARTPEDIRDRLEGIVSRHRRWAERGCQPSQLTWTSERPTVPGWYWGRHPVIQGLIMVFVGPAEIAAGRFKDGAEWAGPIPEPAGPAGGGG